MSAKIKGGGKLAAHLAKIVANVQKSDGVKVGFFANATYSDGTPVAQVALENEYGIGVPVRPFFRGMIADSSPRLGKKLGVILEETDYDTKAAFGLMGENMKDALTDSIVAFSSPANSAATIEKKGFNNPLVDTGHMGGSTGYEVNE